MEAVTGGSERESAKDVPLDTKLKGKIAREESQWFSFTTDETENATYAITSVNQTPETSDLVLRVYDEEEKELHPYALHAGQSGMAATLNLDLLPETTYYVKVWPTRGTLSPIPSSSEARTGRSRKTMWPSPARGKRRTGDFCRHQSGRRPAYPSECPTGWQGEPG